MFEYDEISVDREIWKATCWVTADLPCFQGHFPDKPILPAIAQLEMLSGFVSQVRDVPHTIEKAAALKFVHPIVPNDEVLMTLTVLDDDVSFQISCDDKLVSRGKLIFRAVK